MDIIAVAGQLTEVYGEECMSVQHFRKWCGAFAEGRTMEIHYEERNGRPPVSDAIVRKKNSELLIDFMQPGTTINSQKHCPNSGEQSRIAVEDD